MHKMFSQLTEDELLDVEDRATADDMREAFTGIYLHDLNPAGRAAVRAHLWMKQIKRFHEARRAAERGEALKIAAE